MSQPLTKYPPREGGHVNEGVRILEFLARELPSGTADQAPYLADAIISAGARYDRYIANRKEWFDYARRRGRLGRITKTAEGLVADLCDLDILSRDELASRTDPKEVEKLLGSLRFLSNETSILAREVQKIGRPRDLAEERWILELADIYENAFYKSASVSGSGDEPTERRGMFYRLLEVSRPALFPRNGKLSIRQIDRMLKQRKKKRSPSRGVSAPTVQLT